MCNACSTMKGAHRFAGPAAAALTVWRHPCDRALPVSFQSERQIAEEDVRKHCRADDAWISFNGSVYDITGYIPKHPPCTDLSWAGRVAGRRFEHFLGQDAFGPSHMGCGPDANCSRTVRAELERILTPYRIGQLKPEPPSDAAQKWPNCDVGSAVLRVELVDGSCLRTVTIGELRSSYTCVERSVTHRCSASGRETTQQWAGIRVRDLLVSTRRREWDPLVTFVGMDGFGYSMLESRAWEDDVILAYEQNGEPLDTEHGGPLRLVKHGQHAKWIETLIVE